MFFTFFTLPLCCCCYLWCPARYLQAMKAESPLKKLVIPAAVMPFLAPVAAFAAEGTGRVSSLLPACYVLDLYEVLLIPSIPILFSTSRCVF